MKKKLMILAMTICLLLTPMAAWANSSAYSTGGAITPYYTYVDGINTILGISSSGLATCIVSVDEDSTYNFDYSKLTVYLKKGSGTTVKTFTATKYPSSTGHFTWSDTYQLTTKGEYYIKAVNKLYKNGSVVETITTYSGTDTY